MKHVFTKLKNFGISYLQISGIKAAGCVNRKLNEKSVTST